MLCVAARAPLPRGEQFRIALSYVLLARDGESFCNAIDPARRTLDLSEVADGSLIEYDMASNRRSIRCGISRSEMPA